MGISLVSSESALSVLSPQSSSVLPGGEENGDAANRISERDSLDKTLGDGDP
jgi:hypothetical protein